MHYIAFILYYLPEPYPKEIETHGYLLICLCISWSTSFVYFQPVLYSCTIDPPSSFLAETNEICAFIITRLFSAQVR